MGTPERRDREKKALRQEILDAAREMFVEQGYESVSMRKLAERIEYSPTSIYLHFKDKSELLRDICEETFNELSRTLEELTETIQSSDRDPVKQLRKGLRAYVEFGLAHPHHYQLTLLTRQGPESEAHESAGMRAFAFLQSSVEECVRAKRFKGDPSELAQALWAGVHGVVALLVLVPGFPFVKPKKLIARVIDSMIDGMER